MQNCTREDCPYCDIDFLYQHVSNYLMQPVHLLNPQHLVYAWRYLHPNVKYPKYGEYRPEQPENFAPHFIDWFY